MPDAKNDSALIFMSSKPLTCDIFGVFQAQLSVLHQFGYVSKLGLLWPLTLRTGREDFDHNDPKRACSKLKKSTPG